MITKNFGIGPGDYVGLPPKVRASVTDTKYYFQAMDNFARVFAIRPGERVLMLTDPLLDPRVVDAVTGLANARGATVNVFMAANTSLPGMPEEIQALVKKADFVVSTWFCSIEDPFNVAMRKSGQRWVKITYFRDLDLLMTPQARFPVELVGEIVRGTARRIPEGRDFELRFTDERGSDLRIPYKKEMRDTLYSGNRWRGKTMADEAGCYVHYLACHGPNFWDSQAMSKDWDGKIAINGVLYPQWAIGFPQPFAEKIAVEFKDRVITAVRGESQEAQILREQLMGGKLIEGGGCGFNPKAPRHTVYPAGSNSPGALHFGIDLVKPCDYIRRVMPNWEEPPIHQDLITLDSTVTAGGETVIDRGFLMALRDPVVVAAASKYGDPVELLEAQV
ncbi:MAG: hypothetical protein EXR27_02070 [Betaproteobacteria bacterium]|nr:hypothetical protein [Betaproteobacteria bacterium]